MIVTFDLFSALLDTRTGASRAFSAIADERGWDLSGETIYDTWDGHNETLQREVRPPTSFRDVSRTALVAAYADVRLDVARSRRPTSPGCTRRSPTGPCGPTSQEGWPRSPASTGSPGSRSSPTSTTTSPD